MRAIFKIIKAAADKVSEVKPPKKIISKEDKDRLDTLFNK